MSNRLQQTLRSWRRALSPAASGTWFPGHDHSRSFLVYVPPALGRRIRVPLLVLLHGCGQSAAEFAAATGFTALADRHGFVLACPEQSRWNHQQRCWRWFDAAHQERGAGEPAIIAGITATVLAETARWRIDPDRVTVAGLSAGGGMALILAATYPDVYAAAGVHSAPAYRSAANAGGALTAMAGRSRASKPGPQPMAPVIAFQGTADRTVRPASGPRITEQWLSYAGEQETRSSERSGHDGRDYTVTTWSTPRGRRVLEYWQVDGLGHAWSGGTPDGSFSDPTGPSASAAMWSFFTATRRATAPNPNRRAERTA